MRKLLVVDDDRAVRYAIRRMLEDMDLEILEASSGEEALRLLSEEPEAVLMDVRMRGASGIETLREMRRLRPRLPVLIMTAYGTTETAIEAMRDGAFDYILKPFDVAETRRAVERALEAGRLMREAVRLPGSEGAGDRMVGSSPAMQKVYKLIGQVAGTGVPVLIRGESGTGKELVARAIYQYGPRTDKPFMAVNCAAIPETLLESELFGYEKGAFTGAVARRLGKFEQCDGGTVFLDEIGDLSLATQAKLLRFLQTGEFQRLGGGSTLRADVRLIAATNKDLEAAIRTGAFREDLYYRLNVVTIELPPLRSRKEDIPELVSYFVARAARESGVRIDGITPEALALLTAYDWPGNVRELENTVRRAVVMARSTLLGEEDFRDLGGRAPAVPTGDMDALLDALFDAGRGVWQGKLLESVEAELIRRALKHCGGNQSAAARLLGMNRNTLRGRMRHHNITGPPGD